jgi:two-component system, cell cycle sensor histidine kinase and response regulator CckA
VAENKVTKMSDAQSVPETGAIINTEQVCGENIIAASFCEPNPRHARKTILLVEDEAFVRRVTAEVLTAAGYDLLIARDAPEAFAVLKGYSASIDLLIADLIMPGLSGRELAVEFGRLFPRGGVLLMSGYAELIASNVGHREAYLAKPFSACALLMKVQEGLNQNALADTAVA